MKKSLLLSLLAVTSIWFALPMKPVNAEDKYSKDFQDAYKFAYENGITNINDVDKAKLNSPLTRIAMAKMLSKYAINVLWKKPNNSNIPIFSDVSNKLNEDYDWAVTLAYQLWIMWINMKDNKFRPYDTVTRAEFWTALSRMLYSVPDWSPYYATHLDKLKREWIISNTQSKLQEKRGYVMLMLMRSQNSWLTLSLNNSNTINDIDNKDIKSNTSEKYLTQDEVQKLIEKQEWLKEDNLDSRWYECSYIGDSEICTYEFRYTINWKKYIYYRNNIASWEIRKVQDLWINSAENVALKDAKVSRGDATINQSFSSNWYIITIEAKNDVFVYSMSLDSKIKEKKILITKNKALETILKEIKLEQMQSNIEKENKEICTLSYSFFDDKHDMYQCSFTYWWKKYTSYINAKDWTFIPIKKTGSSIQYWNSVTWKENVVVSETFDYIDYDKAKELLTNKYNIKEWSVSTLRKVWEGKNAIYIYTVDDDEYYIDAINWTKMYLKDDILTTLSKNSWVSKNTIKNGKRDLEENIWMDVAIIEASFFDTKTEDVVSIYSFINQWFIYTYKIRNIDWKILDSKKEYDIWKNKAATLARQTILKKYSTNLKDDYEDFYRSIAYIRFVSGSSSDESLKIFSEPQYVICFTDKSEENIYRVILKIDGTIISNDSISVEDMEDNFMVSLLYTEWYSLNEINELKDKPLEIWWSISL